MIPFLDLQGAVPSSRPELEAAVLGVLDSGAVRPGRGGRGLRG